MNNSYSLSKSPMRSMFSSVFKREDIKLSRDSRNNSWRTSENSSQSISVDQTPQKSSIRNPEDPQKYSRFTTPDNNQKKHSYNYLNPQKETELIKEVSSSITIKDEKFKDMRYEELLKKYDRMQEFYKSQILSLTDEVDHYKILYHKLLSNQNLDRKL